MPPQGRGSQGSTLQHRLHNIELRLNALDAALREVHPEHAERLIARMTELESLCRTHANQVFTILQRRQEGFQGEMARSEVAADAAIARLDAAAQRHQRDAEILRKELGELKEAIDFQSQQASADLLKMERLAEQATEDLQQMSTALEQMTTVQASLEQVEALVAEVRLVVGFQAGQRQLVAHARALPQAQRGHSMPAIIREAQQVATSRSPSRAFGPGATLSGATASALAAAATEVPLRGRERVLSHEPPGLGGA